jgi:hypothetical protein
MAREPEIKAMDPNNPHAQVLTEELERLAIVRNFRAKDFLKFARQAAHRFEPPEAFVCVEEMFRLREYQERHEAGGVGKFGFLLLHFIALALVLTML